LLYAEIDERRRAGDLDERGDVLSILLQARRAGGRLAISPPAGGALF
jgi:cytochrome P450 family 135